MIIDWKKIAQKIYDDIKEEVKTFEKKPTLWAILVWNNSSSIRYINQKRKWAEYTWINFKLEELDKDIEEKDLLELINSFNNDINISWYIIQLPLPNHLNTKKIINSIYPKKDVDWFTPENMWKISVWDDSWLIPCTPAWIMQILKHENRDLVWKKITVLGRSNIVWKPITMLLLNAWATVINCNSKTKNIKQYTIDSDIVISATGKPKILTADMVKKDATIIDVWFTVIDNKIYWDVDFENMNFETNKITPVPGWVWPLTVAMLMSNTIKAYKK